MTHGQPPAELHHWNPTLAIRRIQQTKFLPAANKGADRGSGMGCKGGWTACPWSEVREMWQPKSLQKELCKIKAGLELQRPKSYFRIIASHPTLHDRYGPFRQHFPATFLLKPQDENSTSLGVSLQLNEAKISNDALLGSQIALLQGSTWSP